MEKKKLKKHIKLNKELRQIINHKVGKKENKPEFNMSDFNDFYKKMMEGK